MKPEVMLKLREILRLQGRALSFLQKSSSIIEKIVDAVELRKATPLRKSTEATGAARKRRGGTPQKSLPPKKPRKCSPRKGRAEQQEGHLGQDKDSDEEKGEDTEGGQGREDASDQVRGGSEDASSAAAAALVAAAASDAHPDARPTDAHPDARPNARPDADPDAAHDDALDAAPGAALDASDHVMEGSEDASSAAGAAIALLQPSSPFPKNPANAFPHA